MLKAISSPVQEHLPGEAGYRVLSRPDVDAAGTGVVSQAGGVLLTETIAAVGLDHGLSTALAPWRPRLAVHDPAKVLLDLAVALAVGGDCLADIARAARRARACSGWSPRTRRCPARSTALADDADRGAGRDRHRPGRGSRAGVAAGRRAAPRPRHGRGAGRWSSTWTPPWSPRTARRRAPRRRSRRGFGHHPLWAFVDHGPAGTGEPVAVLLRPGNAGSNTAADHITVIRGGAAAAARPSRRAPRPGGRS